MIHGIPRKMNYNIPIFNEWYITIEKEGRYPECIFGIAARLFSLLPPEIMVYLRTPWILANLF